MTVPKGMPPPSNLSRSAKPVDTSFCPERPGRVPDSARRQSELKPGVLRRRGPAHTFGAACAVVSQLEYLQLLQRLFLRIPCTILRLLAATLIGNIVCGVENLQWGVKVASCSSPTPLKHC